MEASKKTVNRGGALLATALVLVASLLAGAFAASAAATPPQPVRFSSSIVVGPFTGTWSASGAVNDAGTLTEPFVNFVGSGQLHIDRVLTGSSGTITIRIQSTLTRIDGNVATFVGQWVVVSGSGSYANLHAGGERSATLDFTTGIVSETLTGDAHFD